jgi:transposase-like protein
MGHLAMDLTPPSGAGELVHLPPSPGAEPDHRRRRRSWTVEQKLTIVKEAAESGDPVAVVARRHDMNANHLFMWMQQAQEGTLRGRRSEAPPPGSMDFIELGRVGGEAGSQATVAAGVIEIDLPGGVRVRVIPPVEVDALRQVLGAVKAAL